MSSSAKKTVSRRRVFYVPGYDPFPPRRYRELYRKESAEQAKISGYQIELSRKSSDAAFGWNVAAEIEGHRTDTEIEVLIWSDIVRSSMRPSLLGTYAQLVKTAWIYLRSGALFRLMRLRKGPVIAALYPVAMLLLQALAAIVLIWAVYALITWSFSYVRPDSVAGLPILHQIAGLGAGLAAALRLLRWFKAKDNRLFAYYLMHDYAYSAAKEGAYPPELIARMAEFEKRIGAALAEPYDEVLVVGHSSGAHLAVSVLASLVRNNRVPANGPVLGFLSLGQVVPMVSFLPKANGLRADLQFLCARHELAWVDVTAPGDGCAFALCDPVAVSGVAPQNKRWPLVFSAAFTQSLSDEKWNALKRRFFRLHFQYLCAFDRPKDYDYFQITAGPQTLRDRYEGRPASKSRIETPVNRHTSVAA